MLDLWAHQTDAIAEITRGWRNGHPGMLVPFKMGHGKTPVAVRAITAQRRVLIVCPKSVVAVWRMELPRWQSPPPRILDLGSGTTAKRAARLRAMEEDGNPFVAIVNYDAVWQHDLGSAVGRIRWDAIVCDEAQRLKAAGGVASRFLARIGAQAKYRLALSGTPFPHSHLDAYGVMRFVDVRCFGSSNVSFKAHYTRPAAFSEYQRADALWDMGRAGRIKILPHNMDEFARRVGAVTVQAKGTIDLPPLTVVPRYCELEPAATKAYDELERDLITQVEAGTVTSSNALVLVTRLQQISSGVIPTEDGIDVQISTAKEAALLEVLDDLPATEPVVVFARFKSELARVHRVADKLGRGSLELSGARNELATWQAGGPPILAVQVQAGGVGVSMVRAAYMVWWSLPWSLAQHDQAQARLHRPGQSSPVVSIPLIASGTIDERIAQALRDRREIVEEIISGITRKEVK